MVMQENEKRPNAEVDDHIIDRGAQHATGAPGALPVRPVGLCWKLQGTPG